MWIAAPVCSHHPLWEEAPELCFVLLAASDQEASARLITDSPAKGARSRGSNHVALSSEGMVGCGGPFDKGTVSGVDGLQGGWAHWASRPFLGSLHLQEDVR